MRNCKRRVPIHWKTRCRKRRMQNGTLIEIEPVAWYWNRWNQAKNKPGARA